MTTTFQCGDLPPGVTDRDIDGPDYAPEPRREATQADLDEFCGEDLAHLFADWHSDLSNRHHAEAFGRKTAEAWAKYAEKHGISLE